jgi:hypothetical protein
MRLKWPQTVEYWPRKTIRCRSNFDHQLEKMLVSPEIGLCDPMDSSNTYYVLSNRSGGITSFKTALVWPQTVVYSPRKMIFCRITWAKHACNGMWCEMWGLNSVRCAVLYVPALYGTVHSTIGHAVYVTSSPSTETLLVVSSKYRAVRSLHIQTTLILHCHPCVRTSR